MPTFSVIPISTTNPNPDIQAIIGRKGSLKVNLGSSAIFEEYTSSYFIVTSIVLGLSTQGDMLTVTTKNSKYVFRIISDTKP